MVWAALAIAALAALFFHARPRNEDGAAEDLRAAIEAALRDLDEEQRNGRTSTASG